MDTYQKNTKGCQEVVGYEGPGARPPKLARVPQVRSCPPGGWSGARVGVGMLRGAGMSLT